MRNPFRAGATTLAGGICLAALWCIGAHGADDPIAKHRAVADATFAQLLSAMPKPEMYDQWPPKLNVVANSQCNAFATLDKDADGKPQPIVVVYTGEIEKTCEFNSDLLSLTLGHELGHLALGHVQAKAAAPPSEILARAFTRQQEIDADHYGLDLALKANFTWAGIMRNLLNSDRFSPGYSSYEGLYYDHPSWRDRVALLDKDRANLWKSMSAFNNGAVFLATEQYANAQLCFQRITREFPDCAEAWANLGYAQLMQYCDVLDPDDVRRFDLGQIVIGGFYKRSEMFENEALRQTPADIWAPAVASLEKALKLNPKLVLAKGNLAIAYLVNPAGKDAAKATALFKEIDEMLKDPALAAQVDPAQRLAFLINAGVAQSGGTDLAAIEKAWEELALRFKSFAKSESYPDNPDPQAAVLEVALDFNRAAALAKSSDNKDRQSAEDLFATYLAQTPVAAVWWPLAYEKYAAVCKELGATPKSKDDFSGKRQTPWRRMSGLLLPDKRDVALSMSVEDVVELLGKPDTTVNLIADTKLQRLNYDTLGFSLLIYDELLAIILHDEKAPRLEIRGTGLASTAETIYVGMPKEDFEKLFGADRPFGTIDDAAAPYRFYQDLGLGIRFKGGKVIEVVIAPLSRSSAGTK